MMKKQTGHALVLGLGASGISAARLLLQKGWSVSIVDQRPDAVKDLAAISNEADRIRFHKNTESIDAHDLDFAVVSPGIPAGHDWLKYLHEKGVVVIPEFEWGVSQLPGVKIIAVTGSNGKSSLVKWISDTLNAQGIKSLPAGNYGLPPSQIAVEGTELDVVVLELSSFQLEQLVSFQPDVAVLLNLTPNHIDRHGSFTVYAKAKARLFERMAGQGESIIHAPAMEQIGAWLDPALKPWLFGEGSGCEVGFYEGSVVRKGKPPVDLRGTWWGERPLGVNAAAGVAVMDLFGIDAAAIQASAASFSPLAHRMEMFAEYKGVRFINDSKASTLSALAAGVMTGPEKKHLIAGGILKENDVSFVKEVLAKKCAFVYCIGAVAEQLVKAWQDSVSCENCRDLDTAVNRAFQRVKPGEAMLLSPGCSSFDQFTSYAQRGQKFKDLVHQCIQQSRKEEINMQGVRI